MLIFGVNRRGMKWFIYGTLGGWEGPNGEWFTFRTIHSVSEDEMDLPWKGES